MCEVHPKKQIRHAAFYIHWHDVTCTSAHKIAGILYDILTIALAMQSLQIMKKEVQKFV